MKLKQCLCCLGIMVMACFAASAEDKAIAVEKSVGPYTLHYLLPTDNSVLLYCTFTVQDSMSLPVLFSYDRTAMVKSDDMGYKLMNTYNVPEADEGNVEYAYFDRCPQSLNFVLEFEKFPLDIPFDLVENGSKPDAFNLSEIVVDTCSVTTVDSGVFLDATPYTRYGTFIREGNPCEYYSGENFFFSAMACDLQEGITYDCGSAFLTITNNSDHPFDIGPSCLNVTGHKQAGKTVRDIKMNLMNKKECDKFLLNFDEATVRSMHDRTGAEKVGDALEGMALRTNLPGLSGIGIFALGAIIESCDRTDITPYMKELNEAREGKIKVYIEDHTIQAGETYSCFIAYKIPTNNLVGTTINATLDGVTYSFNW